MTVLPIASVCSKYGRRNGGAAAIEHGFGLDNTQLQRMKDKETFLVGELKNNPVDDIEAIKTVQFVMKEGKVIRRD